MARKHDNDTPNGLTNATFQLEKDHWMPVESKIYTLRLDTADGTQTVDKNRLMKTDDKGNTVYRFVKKVPVPVINAKGVTDRDTLIAEIAHFIEALELHDASDALAAPSGSGKTLPRAIKLAVNSKGEPISAVDYVTDLLIGGHTLAIQKQLQKPLREQAETELMEELSFSPAPAKARAAKAPEPTASDPDAGFEVQ